MYKRNPKCPDCGDTLHWTRWSDCIWECKTCYEWKKDLDQDGKRTNKQ